MITRCLAAVLSLAVVVFTTACDDQPTSPRAKQRPRAAISDAANGGANAAVYFLPPITERPNIVGTFNPNVGTAVIQICRVDEGTGDCAGAPIASFGAGQLTGQIVVSSDHYLAVWHTVDSDPALVVGAPYRIQVFTDDPTDVANLEPIAWADVQVVESGKELRNLRTNDIVGLLPDGSLPIKVWLGTDVRCRSDNCITQRVDNTGSTLVLESGNGALVLESGWLPPGFEEVTVTLQREPTGPDNDCVGKAAYVGPGLVAQREACLQVTTDPVIPREVGIQRPAFIFACVETDETDPLQEFLQIIKADDGVPLQALNTVDDAALVALGFEPQCEGTPSPPVGFESQPLMRLASRGVRAITRPLARLLDVKPLYAVDLGQGGEIPIGGFFSYFTLGVKASSAMSGTVPPSAPAGSSVPVSVAITGLIVHPPNPIVVDGLSGIDVKFTITEGNGGLLDPDDDGEGSPSSELTVQTDADGIARVNLVVGRDANAIEAVAVVNDLVVTEPVTAGITGTLLPDLAVTQFSVSPTNPTTADRVTYTIVISNLGEADAPATVGTLATGWGRTVDGFPEAGGEVNPFFEVPAVLAGRSITLTWMEGPFFESSRSASLTLNTAEPVVPESNRGNNTGSVSFTVSPPPPIT